MLVPMIVHLIEFEIQNQICKWIWKLKMRNRNEQKKKKMVFLLLGRIPNLSAHSLLLKSSLISLSPCTRLHSAQSRDLCGPRAWQVGPLGQKRCAHARFRCSWGPPVSHTHSSTSPTHGTTLSFSSLPTVIEPRPPAAWRPGQFSLGDCRNL
jgi:hypothetical protein